MTVKIKSRILLEFPRHLGTLALFTLLVSSLVTTVPLPCWALGDQNHVSFPPVARPCLDAQNVTMSNKVLVVRGTTV